jgi:ATP-binding cassette, subfamily B, bacterial
MKRNLLSILRPYRGLIAVLVSLTFVANAAGLFVPKIISRGIDAYSAGSFDPRVLTFEFFAVALIVFVFTYAQGILQTYVGERVARDMRERLSSKISSFSFARLEQETPAKLLTYLTSDIDAVKLFVSQAVVIIISSVVLIIGASAILISINWKLAFAVLGILPIITVVFALVFRKLGGLFARTQAIMDRINGVIQESVAGAALIRVLDSARFQNEKFLRLNTEGRDVGMKVLGLFCLVIPTVGLIANLASLIIVSLGGHFVIIGGMSLGDFTAFNSYVMLLIFPIIMLGFVSQSISRAQVSYGRISELLAVPDDVESGTVEADIRGEIEVRDLTVMYGEKAALRGVSFKAAVGAKTAIVGPTAAGKTQLLHALIGLVQPSSGSVLYDGRPLGEYKRGSLHAQVALVFQDSVMFNMTVRENVAFSLNAKEGDVAKAIETAELGDFVDALPKGLETVVSERGTSLSGGQKQRIMLARALALNPKVLLLDDFTARVDTLTERKILSNIERNYPGMTIVSVTQKVASAERFDRVILLMEGEKLAEGTHAELALSSPEYAQIIESQKSTNEIRS